MPDLEIMVYFQFRYLQFGSIPEFTRFKFQFMDFWYKCSELDYK